MAFLASGAPAGAEWRTAPDAVNHIDMLRKIQQFCDNNNVGVDSNADITSIAAGGSGYAVGDFLRVANGAADAGGATSHPSALSGATTTFEVMTVSAGVVTAIRLRSSGCYSTAPSNNGTGGQYDTVALTGVGTGCKLALTFSGNGWTINRVTQRIASATIGDTVGTGYTASVDTIALVGGDTRDGPDTGSTTLNPGVLTLPGTLSTGQSFTVTDPGIFHRTPGTDEVATAVLTGTGDGTMTADVVYEEFPNTDTTTDIELIMTGVASTVGLRSVTIGASNIYNLELAGMQAYAAASDWEAQTGISPGRGRDNQAGSYVVLEEDVSNFPYFLSVTDRRIVGVFNIASAIYTNMYLGSFDAYATAAEHPDPTMVLGCSSARGINQGSDALRWGGMNLAIAFSSTFDNAGPGAVLRPGGSWMVLQNGVAASATDLNANNDANPLFGHTYPGGAMDLYNTGSTWMSDDNRILGDTTSGNERARWEEWCCANEPAGGTAPLNITNTHRWVTMGTTAGSEDIPMMFTISIIDPTFTDGSVYGEFDGVKYLDKRINGGSGFLASEDEVDDGTDFWYVFNNCRNVLNWTYFAIRGS